MNQATDLADCSAIELLELYRSRRASPVEATRAVLARIDKLNPKLNAFCHLAPDEALLSAQASEARWHAGQPCGVLDGVPTSIKDLILARGWPTLARQPHGRSRSSPGTSTRRPRRGCAKPVRCCWARPPRPSSAARARPIRR